MSERPGSPSAIQQIQILLHEYDTLRNEIIGRTRDGFTLFSVSAALFLGGLSLLYGAAGVRPAVATAVIGSIAFIIGRRVTVSGIETISAWLIELEARINELAGERLLSWETENSMLMKGWFNRAFRYVGAAWRNLRQRFPSKQ
jgi:hypothetical protein